MTSKEALKLAIRSSLFAKDNDELREIYEAREKLEKDLEILEIIKRKKVAIFVIPLCKNAYDYSMKTSGFERLTDKEFRLVKEWLEE